ncbi:MAG: hypothetical protein D6805_07965, partial [Planctomycetota bacterium]
MAESWSEERLSMESGSKSSENETTSPTPGSAEAPLEIIIEPGVVPRGEVDLTLLNKYLGTGRVLSSSEEDSEVGGESSEEPGVVLGEETAIRFASRDDTVMNLAKRSLRRSLLAGFRTLLLGLVVLALGVGVV